MTMKDKTMIAIIVLLGVIAILFIAPYTFMVGALLWV